MHAIWVYHCLKPHKGNKVSPQLKRLVVDLLLEPFLHWLSLLFAGDQRPRDTCFPSGLRAVSLSLHPGGILGPRLDIFHWHIALGGHLQRRIRNSPVFPRRLHARGRRCGYVTYGSLVLEAVFVALLRLLLVGTDGDDQTFHGW